MFIIIPRRVSTVQIPDRFACDYSEVPTEARGSPTKVVGQPGLQNKPLSQKIGAQKMAQPVKALAVKPDDLKSSPRNHMVKEKTTPTSCSLTATCVLYVYSHTHTHIVHT